MNAALIGCGVVGQRRAESLGRVRLAYCADTDLQRAQALATKHQDCRAVSDWRDAVGRSDIDFVIVATPHKCQPEIVRASVLAGKNVFVEKPGARRADELREIAALARDRRVAVRVGFNHRYHRAFRQARELVDAGALGALLFVRGRYGHGGRKGYEKEWRANPELSGGGELIDQGVHLIDLSRWFLGEFTEIAGHAYTYFWEMPVDDNAFIILKTASQRTAFLHASWTEWKNTFSFELYGRKGKLQIDGLGGSYGTERLTWFKMLPEMGPPETQVWEYLSADDSWAVELSEFVEDVRQQRAPSVDLEDAIAALVVVERIYQQSGYDHRT